MTYNIELEFEVEVPIEDQPQFMSGTILVLNVTLLEEDASFDHALGVQPSAAYDLEIESATLYLTDQDGGEAGEIDYEDSQVYKLVPFTKILDAALKHIS